MQNHNPQATAEMFAAIGKGDAAAAVRALDAGADPNATEGGMRNSPLILTALYHQTAVAEALLKKGADPDYARPQGGETALMMTGFSCARGVAKAIIDAGANVLKQDHFNADAIMHALREGNKEMAKFIEAATKERAERRAREKTEAERRQNLADMVCAVQDGLKDPLPVKRPLRFTGSGRCDA